MNCEMDRRQFLGGLGLGLSIPLAPFSLAQAATASSRRLILVELSGANDGLNTLVPFGDDRYRALRPNIGLDRHELLELNDWQGLNAALEPLMGAWNAGEMAIVQGLGYPQQSRSHFKSIALWETGGDGTRAGRTGWLTDDLLTREGLNLDADGISLDGGMGVFASSEGTWISLTSLHQLRTLSAATRTFDYAGDAHGNDALGLLLERAHSLDTAMANISAKMARTRVNRSFQLRGGELGPQLGLALQLVAHEIETPVLKVQLGGFDTHEHQRGTHAYLLRNLAQALSGLRSVLKSIGQWDNTLVMTYSEFGRRALENQSEGTDHGTAAPHFLMGGAVKGGLWGDHPDLGILEENDLQFTMDYRALYHTVLAEWFGVKHNQFNDKADKRLDRLVG